MSVADVELRRTGDQSYLLVERYDRVRDAGGVLRRLHQEDFCQALGYTSDRKYAADGGLIFRDCFDLLRRAASRLAVEVLKLFDAAIFNLIIGNADAHAKNYGLLYRENGSIELAPLYDLLSTVYYPELSPRLTMKIVRRHTLEELEAPDWEKFAEETGLALRFVRARAKELTDAVSESIGETKAELTDAASDRNAVEEISSLISARARSLHQRVP